MEVHQLDRGETLSEAQDTKTTHHGFYLTGDLYRVLLAWKTRCDKRNGPACPWICHRGGIRLQSFKRSWWEACEAGRIRAQ